MHVSYFFQHHSIPFLLSYLVYHYVLPFLYLLLLLYLNFNKGIYIYILHIESAIYCLYGNVLYYKWKHFHSIVCNLPNMSAHNLPTVHSYSRLCAFCKGLKGLTWRGGLTGTLESVSGVNHCYYLNMWTPTHRWDVRLDGQDMRSGAVVHPLQLCSDVYLLGQNHYTPQDQPRSSVHNGTLVHM